MKLPGWRAWTLICVLLWLSLLLSCSALPRIVPDMAQRRPAPVQLDGSQGPLSVARSKAIIEQLQACGDPSNIFDRHLAIEEAIVVSPLTVGNRVELLQNGPQT